MLMSALQKCDSVSDEGGQNRNSEKWLNSRDSLKSDPTGLSVLLAIKSE